MHRRFSEWYLIGLVFLVWGFAIGKYHVFPYGFIEGFVVELEAYVRGPAEGKGVSLKKKIMSDFFDKGSRYAGQSQIDKKYDLPLKKVRDPKGFLDQAETDVYFYGDQASGYYFVTTLLDYPRAAFGGILLSAQGEVVRVYKRPSYPAHPKLGASGLTRDGNVVLNTYDRFFVRDFCGRKMFERRKAGWHHNLSGVDGSIWAFRGDEAHRVDAKNGKTLEKFSLLEMIGKNPKISIFEPRLIKANLTGHIGQWKYKDIVSGKLSNLSRISLHDPFHHNDIDVLPPDLADAFPMFEAGDLLMSFRSTNLVFVVDPDTLKVKWYSFGEFSRQHDPDWQPDGTITVYDNQSHNDHSRIIKLYPDSSRSEVVFDGKPHGVFKFANGSHDVVKSGGIFVENESEAAHFSADGEPVFYMQARAPSGNRLTMRTLSHLSESEFAALNSSCP